MKRILIAILLLLHAVPAWARMGVMMMGCRTGAVACSGDYGNTTAPSGSWYLANAAAYEMAVQRFPVCAGGMTSAISFWVQNANMDSREIIAVIYADNAGEPGSLLWSSTQGNCVTYGTWECPGGAWQAGAYRTISATAETSGGYVWIGILIEGAALPTVEKADTGGTTRFYTNDSLTPPSSWPTASDEEKTWDLGVYVTY